jgi:hypothetical protein
VAVWVFVAQAGSDTRSLLDYTERFLKQQPKVSGDSAQVPPSVSFCPSSASLVYYRQT